MRKNFTPRRKMAALCAATAVLTCGLTLLACRAGLDRVLPGLTAAQRMDDKLGSIEQLITERYIGTYQEKKLLDTAALGMVVGTGDRWSTYLTAEEYRQHQLDQAGELVGIGVSVTTTNNVLRIRDVYADSPARKAGLRAGDEILAADGITVQDKGTDAVVSAVRGKAGTTVTLTYRHGASGASQTAVIRRAKMDKVVAHARMLGQHIGYVRLDDFDGGAAKQFHAALQSLQKQGATSFVFDVRENPGGLITELVSILDPLLPQGKIVSLTDKSGKTISYSSDAKALHAPMAVLVNRDSISAAELFAAALQEYGAAKIVGEKTIGKGYAQRTYPLLDGSAVVLSDQKYYTPKGKNLANIGIKPDIPVALTQVQQENFYQLTDAQDPQLQAAIRAVEK